MNRLARALMEVVSHLRQEEVSHALVGGLAVSARTEPRFTRDIDLAVAVADDPAAERLVRSLAANYTVFSVVEQQEAGCLATARLHSRREGAAGVVVDLLFGSSGIEPEIVREAESLEIWRDVRVPVARLGHLVALKVLSRNDARPQDAMDLLKLIDAATPQDLMLAREALRLIAARGFGRGRDLELLFEQVLGGSPPAE